MGVWPDVMTITMVMMVVGCLAVCLCGDISASRLASLKRKGVSEWRDQGLSRHVNFMTFR